MSSNTQQDKNQNQQQQQPKGGKGKKQQPKLEFDFANITDLFISTKGRQRRNKQNKLDKICQTEMNIRKGEIKEPTQTQKDMIATKAAVQAEIQELTELLQLYVDSNPNYNKKTVVVEEQKEEEVPAKVEQPPAEDQLRHAFSLVQKVMITNFGIQRGLVKPTDSQRSGFEGVMAAFESVQDLHPGFSMKAHRESTDKFAKTMTDLCLGATQEQKDLNQFIQHSWENFPESPVPEVKKPVDNSQKEKQPEPVVKKEEPVAEKAAEEQPKAEEKPEPVQKDEAVVVEESKDEPQQDQQANNRGRDGRGGRRGRGDGQQRPWTGKDGEWRGNRGGRRPYRDPREDDDGFIMETGEKQPNRGRRGNYRGRGGDDSNRGERGGYRGYNRENRGGNRKPQNDVQQPQAPQQQKAEPTQAPAQKEEQKQ